VVYPIYKALEFLNRRTKNLGIALILLTLAIRALLAPLMFKQLQGSKKMAKIQGEIQKVKKRYNENPMEMQKAIGRLFKENGREYTPAFESYRVKKSDHSPITLIFSGY
jgi:YidC/Oxa1 family membrane protein insertase